MKRIAMIIVLCGVFIILVGFPSVYAAETKNRLAQNRLAQNRLAQNWLAQNALSSTSLEANMATAELLFSLLRAARSTATSLAARSPKG